MTILLAGALFAVVAMMLAWVGGTAIASVSKSYEAHFKDSANRNLAEMFMFVEAGKLFQLNIALIIGAFLVVFLLLGHLVLAALAAAAVGVSPTVLYRVMRERRRDQVIEQLPDSLMAIATSMRAGSSLGQALETVVSFEKGPLIQELGLLQREMRMGTDFNLALDRWHERVPRQEVQLVCAAMKISRETGGNLSETLERIAATLRAKLQMEGKIKSLTAQGKLQGIVMTALPVFLAVVLNHMEPEAMSYLFSAWYGWATIAVIVTLELIGFFFIRKIVNIDV